VVERGGGLPTVTVAPGRLCDSRRSGVAAYPRATQAMVGDAHNRAWAAWGGVPVAGSDAKPHTGVDAIVVGTERQCNRRCLAVLHHDLSAPLACPPAAGWAQGHVENPVGTRRAWLLTPRLPGARWADWNPGLAQRCQARAPRPQPDQQARPIGPRFAAARAPRRPVTAVFAGYGAHPLRVSSTCWVNDDGKRSSGPAAYAGKTGSCRAYADRLGRGAEDQVVAAPRRGGGRGQALCAPGHYLLLRERQPGARRDGAPCPPGDWPAAVHTVRAP
jgi:hypothetical protein